MKKIPAWLLVSISTMALLIVLLFQVNWMVRNARIREDLFNEKAGMVLSRTAEAIRQDRETCLSIEECADNMVPSGFVLKLGEDEVRTIDSLLKMYMKLYNFHVDYTFVVAKPGYLTSLTGEVASGSVYHKPLARTDGPPGIELKLILPGKKHFILAELGPLFIVSVILILVVIFLSWLTQNSLRKERKISEQITDFLNNMTHEFKTPLTNIALAGRMMMKETNITEPSRLQHFAAIIDEENEKLRLQVERVLGMTVLEKGELFIKKEEIDMHDLIAGVVRSMELQTDNKNGTIIVQPEANRFTVKGDRYHLSNALTNLVDNAIRYSGEKPEIFIKTSHIDTFLVIAVTDHGIGIDREHHENVFKKYFRVPTGNVHNVKGFGLGLAYTKRIIEMHGGSIDLQSVKGSGSTFIVKLPDA